MLATSHANKLLVTLLFSFTLACPHVLVMRLPCSAVRVLEIQHPCSMLEPCWALFSSVRKPLNSYKARTATCGCKSKRGRISFGGDCPLQRWSKRLMPSASTQHIEAIKLLVTALPGSQSTTLRRCATNINCEFKKSELAAGCFWLPCSAAQAA